MTASSTTIRPLASDRRSPELHCVGLLNQLAAPIVARLLNQKLDALLEWQRAELLEGKAPLGRTRAKHDLVEGRLAQKPGLRRLASEHRLASMLIRTNTTRNY